MEKLCWKQFPWTFIMSYFTPDLFVSLFFFFLSQQRVFYILADAVRSNDRLILGFEETLFVGMSSYVTSCFTKRHSVSTKALGTALQSFKMEEPESYFSSMVL